MSASETTPITFPLSSTTGNALTRCWRRAAAISLYEAPRLTATTWVVMMSLTLVFISHSCFLLASAAEDDLERASVGGAGEHVVRLFELIQAEAVGDEPPGVDLAAGDQAHQGRSGGGVHQARSDRDVLDPLA